MSNWPSMIDNSINIAPSLKLPLPVRNGREWCNHKKWSPDTIPLQTPNMLVNTSDCMSDHWLSPAFIHLCCNVSNSLRKLLEEVVAVYPILDNYTFKWQYMYNKLEIGLPHNRTYPSNPKFAETHYKSTATRQCRSYCKSVLMCERTSKWTISKTKSADWLLFPVYLKHKQRKLWSLSFP